MAWAPLHWVRAAWVPPPFVVGGRRGPGLLGPCWLPVSLRWACSPPVRAPGLCPTGGTHRPLGGDKTGAPAMQATPSTAQHRTGGPRDKAQGGAPSTRHGTHARRDSPRHPTPHKPTTEPRNTHKRHPMCHHVCAISGWAISGPRAGVSYIGHFAVSVLRTYVAMRLG